MKKGLKIIYAKNDHGGEFKMKIFLWTFWNLWYYL